MAVAGSVELVVGDLPGELPGDLAGICDWDLPRWICAPVGPPGGSPGGSKAG